MAPTMPTICHVLAAMTAALSCATAQAPFTEILGPQALPTVAWSTAFYGSGMATADFDGDTDIDIIVAPGFGGTFQMLRNDGAMTFTDVSATAGLGSHASPHAIEAADVDNDGDKDLYVGGSLTPARLYINNGAGVFTEEAATRGLLHSDDNFSASFGDFDRDGWIDLYLGNRHAANGIAAGANRLYRNTGNGHFVDVTATANCAGNSLTLVATFMDFDEDGWPDLFEVSEKPTLMPNELYRNNGDGTFTPVAALYGANMAIRGMGVDFADAFNDGGIDFYCTDRQPSHLFQVWDPQTQFYNQHAATFGLQGGQVGWGCGFFDYNNDGWQDLYVVEESTPNNLFRNPGTNFAASSTWPDMAPALDVNQIYSQYTFSLADFDDDGNVDILQRWHAGGLLAPNGIGLYQNNSNGGNWIKFRTIGRVSNRDGIGARIEVENGPRRQRQYVRSGIGYLGGSDQRVHFGLGSFPQADHVTITWPSGQRQHLTNVAANQVVDVVEPTLTAAGPAPLGGSATATLSVPGDEGLPYLMVLSFSATNGIPLGNGDVLPIDFDALTQITLNPFNPIFVGSIGTLDGAGLATATLNVPPVPLLAGLTVFVGAVTTDAPTFPIARTTLVNAVAISIQ
tara:strand:- start:5061 stop:6935 length:1875 start_codon:yes stop_codon:yes gene_type:complete